MAERIIASGDARPIPPTSEAPEFLTSGETYCRLVNAPEVATLRFNSEAPDSSLFALGIARTTGAIGIIEVVLELTIPQNVTEALEAARDAVEEARNILYQMQRQDGRQYRGGAQ